MSYVYIGQYYHKFDQEAWVPPEKKIGISIDVPKRESSLNSTNMTIGFVMVKYWKIGDDYKRVENALHALLNRHRYPNTEFFADPEELLVREVASFMNAMGFDEITQTVPDATPEEQHIIDEVRAESSRDVTLLVGETFCTNRANHQIKVECLKDGYRLNDGDKFTTLGKAFTAGIKHAIAGTALRTSTINVWTTPKNAAGLSPDQVIAAKLATVA